MISNTMERFLVYVAKLRRSKVDEEVLDISYEFPSLIVKQRYRNSKRSKSCAQTLRNQSNCTLVVQDTFITERTGLE